MEKNRRNISEAPIDYEGPERMDPSIERKIVNKTTPYAEHPGLPELDRDIVEIISSKRFKQSVDNVRRFMGDTTSIQGPPQMVLMRLMQMAMGLFPKISQIESNNKEFLENLAVELVKREMAIPEGALQFDAKLVSNMMSSAEGMRGQSEEPSPDEVKDIFGEVNENADELEAFMDAMEKFDQQKAKRRFINALIGGASKKGHYMYQLVADELERIHPELIRLYGMSQSILDHLYWIYPEDMSLMMAASGEGQAGQSEIDTETDPPTVKARGITFPILLHELVKGVFEVLGTHGLPDDPRQAEMVMGSEDTVPAEIWDLRLGPIFWEKFTESYPDELFEEDKKFIQHYLFQRFSSLEPKKFFKLTKFILSGDPKGKQVLQIMVDEIIEELNKDDMDSRFGGNDDEDGDYDGPPLSGLGI
jgi:hypothetical protein